MNSSINRIACVIFDMDGTLTRTNELIFESFNHVAEKYAGKRLNPHEIIALFGPPEEGGLAKVVGSEAVDGAMDELCEYYQSHHTRLAALHPGIDGILHYLKSRGVKLAIFTGKGNRTAEITLRELNIARYFDLVVSGSDVVNHKPHHEGITKVIERFALTPDDVLMVGDSLGDVKASRAAGVKVAAVVWDSYDKERLLEANADFVFHTVNEMSEWFKSHIN
jgi:HAD superfamily hydrolase (TIGR01509 family)